MALSHAFNMILAALLVATAIAQPFEAGTPTTGCVTTMVVTQSRLPTPPYWPQCSFDGTDRIYSSTVTMNHSIDCHGCDAVRVRISPVVFCPAMIITATATEATPRTVHQTVCSKTGA